MLSEIERAVRQWRETGSWPEDPDLAAAVRHLVVAEETALAASPHPDHVLDKIEKSRARVRQPLLATEKLLS